MIDHGIGPRTKGVPGMLAASALALALVLAFDLPARANDRSGDRAGAAAPRPASAEGPHRSPIALALSGDGSRLLSANQTAGTVSLIDTRSARVLDETATGEKPAGVALSRDGRRGIVAHWYGYDVALLAIENDQVRVEGRIEVGPEPRGVALSPDGSTAYLAVGVSNEIVRIDLDARKIAARLPVGREPRGIALSPDGARLLVGCARAKSLAVIDLAGWKVQRSVPIDGDNLRQVAFGPDGRWGYVANMKNRRFPTTASNIDLGWVLGQRLTRIELDAAEADFETLSLDPRGEAAGDAHGAAISGDGKFLAVSCGGTHEIMIFRTDLKPLPWQLDRSRDLLPAELLKPDGRFRRVALGGRPTEIAFAPDRKTLYVANYLADAVQIVDAETARLVQTVFLGGPKTPSLARRGEILFHDATRSFNQWYSCNTCHSDGHTAGLDFDTLNDGFQDHGTFHQRSRKKAPTLRRVTRTRPWTWHGWQKSLGASINESFTKTMRGPKASPEELKAIVAYLDTLEYPKNPYRAPDGGLTPEALRGKAVFASAKAGCIRCHGGPELTDGKIHVVGLEENDDVYRGYNPPSLRGVYDKDPYLHDGRAASLRDALKEAHGPETVSGGDALGDRELNDLIAYLKSL